MECALDRIFRLFREDYVGAVCEKLASAAGTLKSGLKPVILRHATISGLEINGRVPCVELEFDLPAALDQKSERDRVPPHSAGLDRSASLIMARRSWLTAARECFDVSAIVFHDFAPRRDTSATV